MDKQIVKEILTEAIELVKPENSLLKKVKFQNNSLIIDNSIISLNNYKNVYVCGSGKASVNMAKAIIEILSDKIKSGVIVSSFNHENIGNIKVLKGSHPVPNEDSLVATNRLCKFLSTLNHDDFLIYLLSGGSSALVEKLPDNLSLKEIQEFTDILLKSGMTIQEMNVLRKKISIVKGGGLLNFIKCKGISLVLSDVIGDDLRYIGSGLLFSEKDDLSPEEIIKKYNLEDKIPEKIKKYLIKPINRVNKRFPHYIIGNNLDFLKTIQKLLKEKADIGSKILTTFLKGEAKEVAKVIVSLGKFSKGCILFGGETTVTVKGSGKGGRNQEMVLSALSELQNEKDFLFASVASDGIDGNSSAAGAIIDKNTFLKAENLKLDMIKFLNNNDSYNFFRKTNDLILTGQTGTNVLDATLIHCNCFRY